MQITDLLKLLAQTGGQAGREITPFRGVTRHHCNLEATVRPSAPLDLPRCINAPGNCPAEVAKLVDALDLGSSAARRESSSLSFRTTLVPGPLHAASDPFQTKFAGAVHACIH